MIGGNQILIKIDRTRNVVDYFLDNPESTINEISEKTGIPSSSVQRYLSADNEEIICDLYGKDTFKIILNQMKNNYLKAKSKGGQAFAKNNVAIKDETGHFIGSKKR